MILEYFKSIKYIKGLVQFNENKIEQIQFVDEYYNGIYNEKTKLRIFYAKNKHGAYRKTRYKYGCYYNRKSYL